MKKVVDITMTLLILPSQWPMQVMAQFQISCHVMDVVKNGRILKPEIKVRLVGMD